MVKETITENIEQKNKKPEQKTLNHMFLKDMFMLALPEPGFSKGNVDVGPHQRKYQNNHKQSKMYGKTKEKST